VIKRDFPSFLLYALGFLLLWEWLRPVEELTDTNHIGTFIVFLLLSFLLSFLNVKWFWQFLIKTIYILASINRFYYQESFFHSSWLKACLFNVKNDIILLFTRKWNGFSNEFRTILFFLLLWIMVYLIHYWLLRRQQIFIFFFMTLVYITFLDTFTTYNAKYAIVRTVVVGFTVMGMLTFYRIILKEKVEQEPSFIRKWMVPLAGMIAFSVLVGVAAPKAAPIWPDPVSYFKAAKSGESNGTKRIGYGTNDDRLGGPFIGDSNSVFRYVGNGKNYWKVETKDVYTGKGWIPSGSTSVTFNEGDLIPIYPIPNSVETIKEYATVYFDYSSLSFLLYPAGVQRIQGVVPEVPEADPYRFKMDTNTDKIISRRGDIFRYTVEFDIPKYKASDLTKTTEYDPSVMNSEFYQRYTSLPAGLPPRIKQLTEQITSGAENWFDKAKAVERYFGGNGYTYDQKNVAYPAEKQDYVDQFLFETKRGYCDNFSTAMAVMLRTIGIPTRWVKGYTGGDIDQHSNDDSSLQEYVVTNKNAHAWVEVFFPNQGWVPFEPTQGFSNELIINYESDANTPTDNQQTTPAPVKKPEKDQQQEDTGKAKNTKKSFDAKNMWKNINSTLKNHWQLIVFIIILLGILTGILYRIRGKWVPYVIVLFYRFKKQDESMGDAYLVLLKQLDRFGLKRQENQTLRSYARYIDTFFSTREMTSLTAVYEQYLYYQHIPEGTWQQTQELWENLIKKTIA
jgi:hypothetical protein